MNRILKGAIALTAAVVLCAGGAAGSTAFWSDAAETASTEFTMGELAVAPVAGSAAWTVGGAPLPSGFTATPGSTLTYTEQFALTMVGDGLTARVTLSPGAVTATAASYEFTSATLTGSGVTADPETSNAWTVTSGGTLTLVMTFTWPRGDTVDNTGQAVTIDIDASTLLIAQAVTS